jgi:hypothetical protein
LRTRWIATCVAAVALGCVPAADDDGETGNDSGADPSTVTDPDSSSGTTPTTADDSGSSGDVPLVTFNQIQPILDANCIMGVAGQACHTMGGSWATTLYTPDVAYETMLEGDPLQSLLPYITPDSLDDSYLWHKINGTHGPPIGSGLQMPSIDTSVMPAEDPGPLAAGDIELFRNWILSGAPM